VENGAVGLIMIRTAQALGATLAITGIDEAAIDPPRYLPQHADDLNAIDFRPRTAIEMLPFPDSSFECRGEPIRSRVRQRPESARRSGARPKTEWPC